MPCFALFLCILLNFLPIFHLQANEYQSKLEVLGSDTLRILHASKEFIFQNQALINSSDLNKESLFGDSFIQNVKEHYEKKYHEVFPAFDHPIKSHLREAMLAVMENNRALIYDTHLSNKGFIPAVFTSQVSAYLTNSGYPIRLHWTAPKPLLFNPVHEGDEWEKSLFELLAQKTDSQHFYYTNSATEFRAFSPLYYGSDCLNCHGAQKKSLSKPGYPESNAVLGQFAGGVSLSFSIDYAVSFFEPSQYQVLVGVEDYQNQSSVTKKNYYRTWLAYLGRVEKNSTLRFSYVAISRGRMLTALQQGTVDIAFPLFTHEVEGVLAVLDSPIAYETPGLCYLKENFVPFTGLVESWSTKSIIVAADVAVIPLVTEYATNLTKISGNNLEQRAIELLKLRRADAFYTTDVNTSYYIGSPNYDLISCNAFTSEPVPLFFGASPLIEPKLLELLRKNIAKVRS